MSFLHHWDDDNTEERKAKFIREKTEELRYDSSMLGGHYRDFEQEAEDAWNRKENARELD